jgi:Flp pilus assembly protein TadD
MTGLRMDDNQGMDAVPVGEWTDLRSSLVGDGSTALIPPRPDADWHDKVATDAEQDGDAHGAEWHLERLAKLRPNEWTIPARRGRVLAAAGRKDDADKAYAAARSLAPSAQVLADWLRAAASDSIVAGRKDAALSNLKGALELTPNDWTLYALRAEMDQSRAEADFDEAIRHGAEPSVVSRVAVHAAEKGNWKRSSALFNSLLRDPTLSIEDFFVLSLANLKAGDGAGYRAACATLAKSAAPVGPGRNILEACLAAKAFTVGPKATDDWTKPLAWTDHILSRLQAFDKANPDKKNAIPRERHLFLTTRGAVLLRAGRFQDAAKMLQDGMKVHPGGGEFNDWVLLAIAEHRLGHADAAKKASTKARAIQAGTTPKSPWDKAEIDLLTAELDAVLSRPGK